MAKPIDVLKNTLFPIASTLATAFGGPFGGIAMGALGKVLGVDPETADPAAMAATISKNTDPDLVLKLKQADDDFQEFLKSNQLSVEQVSAADRANARQMQINLKSLTPGLLTLIVTVGFFGLLFILTRRDVPAGSKEVLDTMVGVLGTAWVAIVNFYFGSSQGSSDKTDILAKAVASK